jgi:4-carboxymuconolactone decarboxylase
MAVADWDTIETEFVDLAASNCDQDWVEELILQTYLFVGFPAALTAARMWRGILGHPAVETDILAEPVRLRAWEERGENVCRTVYGTAYEKLRSNVSAIHPALDRWMVSEGYGKVLGRPGFDLVYRELCIVGLLAAGKWDEQLFSHLRGALLAGAPVSWVRQALNIGLARVGKPEAARLNKVWDVVQNGIDGGHDVH